MDSQINGAQAANPVALTREGIRKTVNGHPVRLLVAESNSYFRQQLKALFDEQGYEVTWVKTGDLAIQQIDRLASDEIDLVIYDLETPKVDGVEFVTRLRKIQKFSNLKTIGLSATGSTEQLRRGLEAGFNVCIEMNAGSALIRQIESLLQGEDG